MNWFEQQTPIDITGSVFPKFRDRNGTPSERFWYVKEEFVRHATNHKGLFSMISAHSVNGRFTCNHNPVSENEMAVSIREMRLFYMREERMSIYSFCSYMKKHIDNIKVCKFFQHMRESWEKYLTREVVIFGDDYAGLIKTNKQLIDAVLYSGSFHSQEKFKKRYDELLEYMDESLIVKIAYNAICSSYQIHQICRAISQLSEDFPFVMLPNHLSHEWDESCPYGYVK